uniref:Uncharacterized protein n=1 Tax=Anguilla anguilla TaxID=7936 RepID=A0A0E9R4U9_ANGAN
MSDMSLGSKKDTSPMS